MVALTVQESIEVAQSQNIKIKLKRHTGRLIWSSLLYKILQAVAK